MDEKTNYRKRLNTSGRWPHKRRMQFINEGWKWFYQHRSVTLTIFLLLVSMGLLFALVAQFAEPTLSTVPGNVTSVSYTTFMNQEKSGNLEAVVVQGNDVNGLLFKSLNESKTTNTQSTTHSIASENADYVTWTRSLGMNSGASIWSNTSIDRSRAIFMQVPVGGQGPLLASLESAHVQVSVLPTSQSSQWFSLALRFLPLLGLIIVFILFFSLRNKQNPIRSIDDRLTNMGKSRARRTDRPNEFQSTTSTRQKELTPKARTNSISKPVEARVHTIPHVTFADVAGIDEVRQELIEIVHFLREPGKYSQLGAHIPRGALLVGMPGTGKTLLAKAVAGEARVPFFSMSASEFVEMYVGVGASRVRDLFQQARQVSPCVVFIDEIDAVGRKRTARVSGNDERDQTLNQLLVELDGFDSRHAVVVLAATNRVDILDKALLRPGRFDRRIMVSPPDRIGREAILRVHTRQTPLHESVSLERLARLTTGMTGADLANLVNEAALVAARRNLNAVDHECFEDALARVQLGAVRPIVMSDDERRIIAVHESGHALVAHHLPEADTVNRVTILPRGQSLGVTQFTSEVDRYNYSRQTLMARIAVGLGGRVAEELTLGKDRITTGAENDLQVVTDLARKMVTRWGMSERIGTVFVDSRQDEYALTMRRVDADDLPQQAHALVADEHGRLYLHTSGQATRSYARAMSAPGTRSSTGVVMSSLIDAEVQRIVQEGHEMARAILVAHADQLTLLSDALMEHEQLDRTQFEALLAPVQ